VAASKQAPDAEAAPDAAPSVPDEITEITVEVKDDVVKILHEIEADNYARGHESSKVVQDYEPAVADGSAE
jgi:hypothetical protein